ncbi:MAG TPA: type 4a pilus biogenesis protein PilO [Pirellulales bacterium]|jgi:Tfp pilus assembly protein PilO|nr:type 4a pilus biogenesis protein PilO [Pirellulales bacterium]
MKRNSIPTWAITIPIAAAACAYVWFSFVPQMRSIHDLRAEMQRQMDVNKTASEIAAQITRTSQQLDAVNDYIRRQEPESGEPAQISRVLRRIAEAAKRSGVQTTKFVPETPAKLASLERVPVKLGCRGTLSSVCDLLAELEGMHGHLWIDELSFEPLAETGQQVQAEINLAIFVGNSEKSG